MNLNVMNEQPVDCLISSFDAHSVAGFDNENSLVDYCSYKYVSILDKVAPFKSRFTSPK